MVRIILIALLGLVAAIVGLVFILRPEPPRLPLDRDHAPFQRVVAEREKGCLHCHGPGEKNARKPSHPLANDCFRCHSWREA